ncbi:very short patch repair endonuclease [Bacillus sp. P14.5]|uniref:very short patch repair endonuclease n=1 Tax=Bacillus sp. P14.5 TaxID=1983400 RepID=UPI000DEBF958|nr:very short patch repair endonuclease [Bacillus sp. P14.5]
MTDNLTREQRTKNMKAIRSQSKLENRVSRELWQKGIRFRKNVKSLPGKPDIAIKKYKVVIFIDSCFWHVCPSHGNMPKSNQDYWLKKLKRNQERDKEINKYYLENNWELIRIWEHEFKKDYDLTIDKVVSFIKHAKE